MQPIHQNPTSWSRKARDYESLFVPFSERAARAALERLTLAKGEHFLDVAAGTGAVTLRAQTLGARVLATDFSDGMLAILDSKLRANGVEGVETRVMDGQALDLADGTFDAAGSNLGLIFFPDPAKGLSEMLRVLRPGGRAFVTSLHDPAQARLMQLVVGAVFAASPDFRPSAPPARIQLSSPDEMTKAFEDVGFVDVTVVSENVAWPLSDPGEFWDRWALDAPPVAAMMAEISNETRATARRRFVASVEEESGVGPVAFENEVLIGKGHKRD